MSIVYTELTLTNDVDTCNVELGYIKEHEVRRMTVEAIVDTGAWTIIINEETRDKLGLLDRGYGEATLANGQKEEHTMAGPLEIKWRNRRFTCDALVLPNAPDILLGAIPLEGMDLTVNPKRELVGVHGDKEMHRV